MIHPRACIFSFLLIISITACKNNADQNASQKDTSVTSTDTTAKVSDTLVYEDCYEKFFQGLGKVNDSGDVMLTLKNGSKVTFKSFAETDMAGRYARYGVKSLDNDTTPELVVYNYTGGAHCCDEIHIFSRQGADYSFKAKLFGGFVCIDPATNIFTYSLNETLGYFFACYACGFSDSTSGFKTIREIQLRYAQGKLELVPYDAATGKQLIRNLEILNKHGYEELEGLMDNGWRKEFAMNFAVWHYNNGKNWNKTKKIYDKYYTFKDATGVWKELYTSLKDAGKESSL
ncbi:MAG: hypothetical protein H7Y03_05340 [Chitinophagaceae bacterium]|nr:hypothetical protein [Chitinophagaceae bacterium]